jgi:glycosyltransferase involved in cell wall biosynthesis
MKIILVENERLDHPPMGGISTLIRQLLHYSQLLDSRICFAGTGTLPQSTYPGIDFIQISSKKCSNLNFFLKFISKVFKIQKEKDTVFHFFHPYFILIFYFFRKQHPLVLSITGRQDISFERNWGKFAAFINTKVVLPLAFKRVDHIVFVDENTRKYYLSRFNIKSQSSIIPSSVDVNKFDFQPVFAVREKYGFMDSAKLILFAGRISPEKKLDFLIQAFQLFSLRNPDTFLLIAGNGPELSNIKRMVIQLGIEHVSYFEKLQNNELVELMNI